MRRIFPALLLLAVACASTPDNPYRPDVRVSQRTPLNFGATTRAPLGVDVYVKNVAAEPMTLQLVKLESGFTQQYRIDAVEQGVNDTLAPGETKNVRLTLIAVSQQGVIDDPEPLNLRGFVTYTVGGKQFQDLYIFRPMMQ